LNVFKVAREGGAGPPGSGVDPVPIRCRSDAGMTIDGSSDDE
jgi:hypothetical protein